MGIDGGSRERCSVTSAFVAAFTFNVGLATIFLIAFCCVRKSHPEYYQPRCLDNSSLVRRLLPAACNGA